MERDFSYSKANAFFEELSEKHIDIKDYCSTSPSELSDKISSVDGVVSPILIFFDYSGRLEGPVQRTFNVRSLAFSIAFFKIDADDYPKQRDAIDKAEAIALEVLSRIKVQSQMPGIGWLYNNFIKESVIINEIEYETGMDFFGVEVRFDLKIPEPMVVQPQKWSDGNIFCTETS